MMYRAFLLMCLCYLLPACCALAQYTTSGRIEYERKTNVHAVLKDNRDDEEDNSWFESIKSQTPQFKSAYFDLVFDTGRSIYKPGREVETTFKGYTGDGPANENIVLTDFTANRVKAVKLVYEQKFLVQDSIRNMEWVEKSDIRTIAGYKCHKAVGRICDSVYVVAFYTEDIPTAGGPEMFAGLPGMILELAIPRLHTTWTAGKIEMVTPKETDFTIPEKGKKVNQQELAETIKSSLKDWGKWAARNCWWTSL